MRSITVLGADRQPVTLRILKGWRFAHLINRADITFLPTKQLRALCRTGLEMADELEKQK